jgi:sugar/nucleoside kinase (ribokinase family)
MKAIRILTIGELIVEVMRASVGKSLAETDWFKGPYPSGAPGIFIYNAASLGMSAGIISCVGNDPFAECCLDYLGTRQVDLSAVVRSPLSTGVAFVTYNEDGSRQFLFHLGNSAAGQLNEVCVSEEYVRQYQWLHLNGSSMSMNDNVRNACVKAAKLMKANGGIVSFDPNIRKELLSETEIQQICEPILPICDYVMPSEGEELTITGQHSQSDAIDYLLKLGVKKVYLKLGSEGSQVFSSGSSLFQPSYAVEEVDPTGAGDSYCAGVVFGIIKQWDDLTTLRFANALGAYAASHFGPMAWETNEAQIWKFVSETSVLRGSLDGNRDAWHVQRSIGAARTVPND